MFVNENAFCEYLSQQKIDYTFTEGNTLISVNMVRLKPTMSCIYLDDQYFAAAKYHQQLGFFSDALIIPRTSIQSISYQSKGLNYQIKAIIKEKNQQIPLNFQVSKMSPVSWHRKNLNKLLEQIA
ncbi:hypothetical protein [Enterococcus columbae]|uniref:YokE-like PH domain-containing protein n=1 Tax=Enterococcus columbae DSM 7374 = ATCC 51263 TaxID=1121865 RepID=S0KML2_9ENTE|nr:hypothetical protein [Enterococcus columbae]EOT40416.1 hypothetical protein OMW_01530 [Enterococcus columbae DSM 7374 = ATCC 51263]EOW80442.1 hypothetical protein I568_02145 [Enterococcus columbae DSM 7374 = ATCC 51263]OJG23726.1 hypothetical protein RR47_GL000441 [Enterococcus columbae DSM 7374 = ATCC 51263]